MASKHIELINDYIVEGEYDFEFFDNTGVLIRCRDCQKYIGHDKRCGHWNHGVKEDDYCSYGVRKDA